jgi:DNA polymerase III delta prime subunit
METYHDTARFILTCNYPHKVIPALHSRCQGFHIDKIDPTEFTARVAHIMLEESIEFELDVLDNYVKATYPDLRKCINLLQMNSTTGKLVSPHSEDAGVSDYKIDMVELVKKGQYREARELLCKQIRPDEIDDMYRWMYDNLELWSDNPDGTDKAILIIRKGLVNHTLAADPEINLAATLIELSQINS